MLVPRRITMSQFDSAEYVTLLLCASLVLALVVFAIATRSRIS